MSPEAQRIAIAEVCGWVVLAPGRGRTPEGKLGGVIPDYLNDLNACHEMETFLKTAGRVARYCDELNNVIRSKPQKRNCYSGGWDWHATAAQRAEAFLRTLKLWKEDT